MSINLWSRARERRHSIQCSNLIRWSKICQMPLLPNLDQHWKKLNVQHLLTIRKLLETLKKIIGKSSTLILITKTQP
ncbi:hypothetical protein JAB4_059480 (plasmid) [Janthinobacterium sp. HH102]|nr:hypothetical protein JAB4_059480 [Janthinobacterium sp. HH102]